MLRFPHARVAHSRSTSETGSKASTPTHQPATPTTDVHSYLASGHTWVIAACLALTIVFLAPSTASAIFTRPFIRQLTETPLTAPVPGPLIEPYGVAVAGNGDVYVTSDIPGNNTGLNFRAGAEAVDRF